MSLIGEALKRARLEAARRDAEERGAVYSEAPAYVPQRRGLGRWPTAGILLAGLALGVLVGTVLFVALRRARPAPQEIAAVPLEARPAPVATSAEAMSPPAPPAAAAMSEAAPTGLPVPPPTAAPLAESEPVPARPSPPEAATIPARPADGRREPPPPPPPFVSGRSYLRTVVAPSGERLELDGIVASAEAPLTMINRQLLSPGETVEGFTVEQIEPNQVKLRSSDGTVIFLRLRDAPPD